MADDFEALGKESFDDEPAAVVLQSGGSEHFLKPNILRCCQLEIVTMDSGSGSRWPTDWLLSFHHIIQHIHVARLGSVPPRRARTFVGQTAGCRTKVHLAPVRRRVQFRYPQRTIPLPKKQLQNKKISGGFSAAILRRSSGIKRRCCRPCEASGGHREPTSKNRITLRADGFKPTHDGMYIRWRRDFSK